MPAHLVIIHFPIVLVVVAAVLDLFGIGLSDRGLRDWSWRFLLVGALGVFFAFATGEGARLAALSVGGVDLIRLDSHQLWGSAGLWLIVVAALLRSLWRHRSTGVYGWLNLLLVLVAAACVIAVTISGTMVRHGG